MHNIHVHVRVAYRVQRTAFLFLPRSLLPVSPGSSDGFKGRRGEQNDGRRKFDYDGAGCLLFAPSGPLVLSGCQGAHVARVACTRERGRVGIDRTRRLTSLARERERESEEGGEEEEAL